MNRPIEYAAYRLDRTTQSLWDRILGLIEQDLAERRGRKLFAEVHDEESGRVGRRSGSSPPQSAKSSIRS